MPTFEITAPDGRKFRVEGPVGSTKEDALAQVQARVKPALKQIDINGPTNPTDGMSTLAKVGAGAVQGVSDIGRGIGQRLGMVSQAEIDEAKKLDAPLLNTGAGIAGNVIGKVGAFAPAALIPGINTLTGAALAGGAMGLAEPTATGESVGKNVAIGAAGGLAGQGIANALGRLNKPVQSSLNANMGGLAQKAESMGIPLTVAQRTGSRPLQITESVLENLPFTADKQLAIKQAQKSAFNKAASKTIGENADLITPEVLSSAKTRIGQNFEALSARNVVGLDDDFVNALAALENNKTVFSSPKLQDTIDKALELASKGQISGKEYQKVRSSLGKAAQSAFTSDADLGQALKAIKGALDEAATKSVSKADQAAWMEARKQWQALKVLEKAASPVTADAVAGNVSPSKLASALNSADKNFKYGKGQKELGDLARIGQAFVKDQIPNSGTAQRQFYQQVIENPLRLLSGAAGVGSMPVQAMLNSRAGNAYLMNGLLPQNQTMGLLGSIGSRGAATGIPGLLLANQ